MDRKENLPGAKELLNKYLENKCSPEEEQQVLRWYFSFTKEDDLMIGDDQQNKMLQSLKQNVLSVTTGNKNNHHSFFSLNTTYIRAAALLVLVCSAAFAGFYYQANVKNTALVYRELKTVAGERKMFMLADGTRVWLNNETILRYPVNFDSTTREVNLKGEAFFEVVHQKEKPFLVHTQNLHVQVLGTSFDVKSYDEDKEVAVNVATGKVAVYNQAYKVMLEKGQKVVYNRMQHNFIQSANTTDQFRAWQNNTLYFRYETLEAISLSLERWYGVRIRIKSEKLLQKRYTLEQYNETLENVMKVLSTGEFNYKITGRSVVVW